MTGFDCSGLVQEILASVGEDPPGDQTAHTLFLYFQRHGDPGKKDLPASGDLAFFGSECKISHVGFCIDRFRMVEAGGGGRDVRNRKEAAAKNAYIRVRPIDSRRDLVDIIAPKYRKK